MKYTSKFRKEAVESIDTLYGGVLIAASRGLGVPDATLCVWRQRYKAGTLSTRKVQSVQARATPEKTLQTPATNLTGLRISIDLVNQTATVIFGADQ